MKKSRLLVVMLVMLFAASAYAQDSYREAVKDYWSQYTNGYLNQLDSVFKSTNKVWFQSGDLDLDQLADCYLEERLMDYMTDLFLPKVKELGVSEAALRENAALCSTPAGKTYMEHLQQLTEVMRADIASLMDNDNLTIKNGATSDPVQIKAGIDAGYVAKYKDVADLAEGIQYVLSHDMRDAALHKAASAYGETHVAQKYINVYEILCMTFDGRLTTEEGT